MGTIRPLFCVVFSARLYYTIICFVVMNSPKPKRKEAQMLRIAVTIVMVLLALFASTMILLAEPVTMDTMVMNTGPPVIITEAALTAQTLEIMQSGITEYRTPWRPPILRCSAWPLLT